MGVWFTLTCGLMILCDNCMYYVLKGGKEGVGRVYECRGENGWNEIRNVDGRREREGEGGREGEGERERERERVVQSKTMEQ